MRKLSLFDATLLVMGGIVGVGIFFTPQGVAERVREPWAFMGLWVFGGGVAMAAAFTFAELGRTFPRTGGWFVFLREAFGDFPAYLFAWVVLLVVSTGAMAAILLFAADALQVALPEWLGPDGSIPPAAAATTIIVLLTAVAMGGTKQGARLQNVCMITKLVVIGGLVVAGLVLVTDGASTPSPSPASPAPPLARGVAAALLPVFFSYGGWQLVTYLAPELDDPVRMLPRAIVGGVLGVIVVYLAANAAFVAALGLDGLAADPLFAASLARSALGETGERLLSAGMAVSAIGVCAVNVIATPWLYVAMSRERLFFATVGRLHPKSGAPVNALALQALLVLVYMYAGTLQDIVDAVVFVEWIFHGLVALALLRLRRARPELPRPFRSPLYPVAPWVYAATAALVVGGTLWQAEPRLKLTGLGVVAVGALVYGPWRRLVARSG